MKLWVLIKTMFNLLQFLLPYTITTNIELVVNRAIHIYRDVNYD